MSLRPLGEARTALRRTHILLAFLLAPIASSAVFAQASISGAVIDQTGLPLPGVVIEIRTVASGVSEAATEMDGTYRFDNVPTGPAHLSYRLINFAAARRDVMLLAGENSVGRVTLALSLSANVTVTGPRTFRNLADLENPAESLIGIAEAASEGAVTAKQLEGRPFLRAGELLETVPGVIVSQHSGEGKANQYYLRGFNLDHGTDLAISVAGVPVNLPTHAHGHGYSDLSFLIPELVSGIQFRKGSYSAEDGDFSAAGSSNINYVDVVDRPFAQVDGGQAGWQRFVGAASPAIGAGHLLAALEVNRNNGPWVRSDDYNRLNGVLRYSRGDTHRGFSLMGMAYRGVWNSTDQIPERAVAEGLITRFGSIDPSDGGISHRYSVVADAQLGSARRDTHLSAFALHYDLNLFSNFTYFLDDPANGDQFEQEDRRWVTGGRVVHQRLDTWGHRSVETSLGAQIRHDDIGAVGLFRTRERERLSTTRLDQVGQTSTGAYVQSEIEWAPRIRTVLGLRGDVYHFGVTNDNPLNSGTRWNGLVSPKGALIVGPWQGTELYVNAGTGFHSNDARGATITVDPSSGDPVDRVSPLVRTRAAEVGVRTVRVPHVQSTVAFWTLSMDSELLFVGDAGTTEASRPSRRYGVEWSTYTSIRPWLTVDGDYSLSRAHFTDEDSVGSRIPGSLNQVLGLGVTVNEWKGLLGSLRLRHFGPRPLIEDGSIHSKGTSLVNLEGGYRLSRHTRLVAELFNALDAKGSDIDYYYTSRLPGEPADGVSDIHSHPAVPRTFRVSLKVAF